MNCPTCPRAGLPCLGERLPHLCTKANYREYLQGYDPGSPPTPTFLGMATSLARAAVAHVGDGMRIAPEAVQEARRAVCEACPLWNAAKDRCSRCSCNLKIKLSWASSACPLDPPKWTAV